eukprot:g44277.t1
MDLTYKVLDKGGICVPNAALILMATFTCDCNVYGPSAHEHKCHYVHIEVLPDLVFLYHPSFMGKFVKKNTFGHMFIKKWSPCNIFQILWENERNKELTSTECCRLAHSKVHDAMLMDALRASLCQGILGKDYCLRSFCNEGLFSYQTLFMAQ